MNRSRGGAGAVAATLEEGEDATVLDLLGLGAEPAEPLSGELDGSFEFGIVVELSEVPFNDAVRDPSSGEFTAHIGSARAPALPLSANDAFGEAVIVDVPEP